MVSENRSGDYTDEVDRAMLAWCQGDVVLESDLPFLHLASLDAPLTDAAIELAGEVHEDGGNLASVATSVKGFVVLSQTCDIVRSSRDRPFVELAPLIDVDCELLAQVTQGRRPHLACVPAVEAMKLVADLDRVMTVEKAVLVGKATTAKRTGCPSDPERRAFAEALARKRRRFAFPDDFNKAVAKLAERVRKKHGRYTLDGNGDPTPEGEILAQLADIRVLCSDWQSPSPELTFLFVFEAAADIHEEADQILEDLIERFKVDGRFSKPETRVVGLDQLPTADWLRSDSLEYDHLSGRDED